MPAEKLDVERLRHLIEVEQLQQWRVAELLGCSRSCVERTCRRHGIKTQRTGPRSGPLHPDWRGGRKLVGRYWYIWTKDHPHRTMGNYVAEHRLVVEAKLGRYLERHEVVHHINGDPQDNRPENLAVFQTNADHLRHELSGKPRQWTPEWKERLLEGAQRARNARRQAARGGARRSRTSARTRTTDGRTAPEASGSE